MEEIELEKPANVHLGFSIAGGITHEHVKGLVSFFLNKLFSKITLKYFSDHGLFITNIIPGGIADKSGRLKVGDRLLHVQSMVKKSIYCFTLN